MRYTKHPPAPYHQEQLTVAPGLVREDLKKPLYIRLIMSSAHVFMVERESYGPLQCLKEKFTVGWRADG